MVTAPSAYGASDIPPHRRRRAEWGGRRDHQQLPGDGIGRRSKHARLELAAANQVMDKAENQGCFWIDWPGSQIR
jgi:hypothetical protein